MLDKRVMIEDSSGLRAPQKVGVSTKINLAAQKVSRVVFYSHVTTVIVILVSIMAATGTALAVVFSRPTRIVGDNHGGSYLVDTDGHNVATAKMTADLDLTNLPANGRGFDYNQIEDVTLAMSNEDNGQIEQAGFRTYAYYWYNETDMDLFLHGGMTLHISQGAKWLAETVRSSNGATPAARRRLIVPAIVGVAVVAAIGKVAVAAINRNSAITVANINAGNRG